MPKRTNEFQRIVKYIYSQIVPAGGQVTESACLRERGNGPEREIDILIEYKIAGHSFRIAVEARDHGRDQTLEWIDSLIGKYSTLPVNLVVAVSSKKFSLAAKEKAADHRLDLITVNEALTTDWRKRIESWKMMTHSFTLMTIITLDAAGHEITYSDVSADGGKATHRDELSEFMYNALHPWFMTNMSEAVKKTLEAKIAEAWQTYIHDPKPRWAEVVINKPPITRHGKDMGVDKVIFGVGTFFHVGNATEHFALKEHALSVAKIETMRSEVVIRIISDAQGTLLKFDPGTGSAGGASLA